MRDPILGRGLCCAIMVLLGFTSGASADLVETLTYEYGSGSLVVPMFDDSLGVLDKVTLTLEVQPGFMAVTVANTVEDWMDFGDGELMPVFPTSDDFVVEMACVERADILGQFGSAGPSAACRASGVRFIHAYEIQPVMFEFSEQSGGNDSKYLDQNLGAFIGTGDLTVDISRGFVTSAATSMSPPIGGWPSTPETSSALFSDLSGYPRGTVVYTYTVPEPATMSLLALGALAMLRRRRTA